MTTIFDEVVGKNMVSSFLWVTVYITSVKQVIKVGLKDSL